MSYTKFQDLAEQEQDKINSAIRLRLPRILEAARSKGWDTYDADQLGFMYTEEGRLAMGISVAVLDGGYCLLYCVAHQWWIRGASLIEQFLVAVTDEHCFAKAVASIDALARDEGCVRVITGTAAADDKVYPRLLRRYGFVQQTAELVRPVKE